MVSHSPGLRTKAGGNGCSYHHYLNFSRWPLDFFSECCLKKTHFKQKQIKYKEANVSSGGLSKPIGSSMQVLTLGLVSDHLFAVASSHLVALEIMTHWVKNEFPEASLSIKGKIKQWCRRFFLSQCWNQPTHPQVLGFSTPSRLAPAIQTAALLSGIPDLKLRFETQPSEQTQCQYTESLGKYKLWQMTALMLGWPAQYPPEVVGLQFP